MSFRWITRPTPQQVISNFVPIEVSRDFSSYLHLFENLTDIIWRAIEKYSIESVPQHKFDAFLRIFRGIQLTFGM